MRPIDEVRARLKATPPTAGSFQERRDRWEALFTALCPTPDGTVVEPLPAPLQGEWVRGPGVPVDAANVLIYIHGGGFTAGTAVAYRGLSSRYSTASGCRVMAIDYRFAPEQPYPAALDDCVAAYRWLARRTPPQRIALAGDSAGGNLVVALLLRLRDAGDPLPAACAAVSPIYDMALTGESVTARADRDPAILPSSLRACSAAYIGDADRKTPCASPLYADLHGLPPLLLQCGSEEMLRDDSARLAAKAKAAGVDTTFEEWPDMIHVWHLYATTVPEAREGIERLGAFVRRHCG